MFFFKYTFTVRTFEGETFSQDQVSLVEVCKPAKIAARWRCGFPIKKI